MKKFFPLIILALLFFYFCIWRMPSTQTVSLKALPPTAEAILLPLDGRPVCTSLPKQLGELAGIKVILPPIGFLDNYSKPAQRAQLYLWLRDTVSDVDYAFISSDLLIHGGLLNSRLPLGDVPAQNNFLKVMSDLRDANPKVKFACFSIIPRLLVSDQLIPDSWYQWHLMRYTTLRDMTETFNDLDLTREEMELAARIPDDILQKYSSLYMANDRFNKDFVKLSATNFMTVIGQDDGSVFGLPNRNLKYARIYEKDIPNAYITYGADEVAAVLLGRAYLQQQNYKPKIFLQYAAPGMEFMYMPFMSASVGETLRDKLNLIGAEEAENIETADIVIYINCGSKSHKPNKEQAEEVWNIIKSNKKTALIDLSANFNADELLLPVLLEEKVAVNKLVAYAGWNTFSNSAGTAIAQSVIFVLRCRQLDAAELPDLYAANVRFLVNRILEDYIYQKLYHDKLRKEVQGRNFNPSLLTETQQQVAHLLVQQYMNLKTAELLHYNLGCTPFFVQDGREYYIKNLQGEIYFPWKRIFEIGFDLQTTFGCKIVKERAE
ncbi:MAG: DUF4127 family protein [Phascolarctobacterium sp.]|nr:DUF4127 family protein [Phascolarctobacterium sp.]